MKHVTQNHTRTQFNMGKTTKTTVVQTTHMVNRYLWLGLLCGNQLHSGVRTGFEGLTVDPVSQQIGQSLKWPVNGVVRSTTSQYRTRMQ